MRLYIVVAVLLPGFAHVFAASKGATMRLQGNTRYPADYKLPAVQKRAFGDKHIKVNLHAVRFAQGHAVYIEALAAREITKVRCFFAKRTIPLTKKSWGYGGLFGISVWSKVGKATLKMAYFKSGRRYLRAFEFRVEKTKYPVYRSSFAVKNWSNATQQKKPKVIAQKKRDWAKKKRAFARFTPDVLTEMKSHPRNMHKVTSAFWSKRIISRFKTKNNKRIRLKPRITWHHGLDLKGRWGAPIYAIATGKVAISKKMFFEGNFILLDHGNKIFSGYMHQSKLMVQEGDIVNAGQQIGATGSTGAATGPHLHVFLLIRGVYVDPLSLLPLPIRN